MSKEITGFLILENRNSGSFIPKNDVQFILGLNEGHDRPVWEWMLNCDTRSFGRKSTLVPEAQETVILDGLVLLIADGLQDESLLAKINQFRRSPSSLIDLNSNKVPEDFRAGVASSLDGYMVNIVILPGSLLLKNVSDLANIGIEYRILS
jgi:hypothetical protein